MSDPITNTDSDLTAAILDCDAAELAIENAGDTEKLKDLAEFGKRLTKYAIMMINQQDRVKQEARDQSPELAPVQQPNPMQPNPAPTLAVPVTPPPRSIRARVIHQNQAEAPADAEALSNDPSGTGGNSGNIEEAEADDCSVDTSAAVIRGGRSKRRIFGPSALWGRSRVRRSNDADVATALRAETVEEHTSEAATMDEHDDALAAPGVAPDAMGSSNVAVASIGSSNDDVILPPSTTRPVDYDGSLKQSQLFASTGRTRMALNERLPKLGLKSSFGQGVVSGKEGTISHLTLSSKWNNLPYHDGERLQWYVGEGPIRLKKASPLDPLLHAQDDGGVPIFWAVKQLGGGDLCHYIGHWVCVRFERLAQAANEDEKMIFKKEGRSALLEFEFVTFDDELDWNMFKNEVPRTVRFGAIKKEGK